MIFFSLAGVMLESFLFFDFRFRSLLKYLLIKQGTEPKQTGLEDPSKEVRIDKEELFRQNRKGSYFRDVRR